MLAVVTGVLASSNTSPMNPVTRGPKAPQKVEKSVALLGAGITSATVVATWATTTTRIICGILGTTADGLTPETIAAAGITVIPANIVAATGFDVFLSNPNGLVGTVRVECWGP